MVKISVIVPTYNRAKYIKKCVDSILNQTLSDFELIIIDDGSTDDTDKIIKKYSDSRIKYFKRINHGIGSSRNFGIEKAKGEYLTFVDSDDFISNNMLELMYNKAKQGNLDTVVCDYSYFYEKNKKNEIQKINNFENTNLQNNKRLLLDINLGPCNKIFKRKLFFDKSKRFPENIKYEDMYLIATLLKDSKKIGKVNEVLSYFLTDNKSETTTVDTKVFDIFISLDKIREYFKEPEYNSVVNEFIIRTLSIYIIQQRNQKSRKIRNEFIDKAYNYMIEMDINYKKNNYFKNRNIVKAMIEKNKLLAKIYCNIYAFIKTTN